MMEPTLTCDQVRRTIGEAVSQLAELNARGGPTSDDRRALMKSATLLIDAADALEGRFVAIYPDPPTQHSAPSTQH